MATCQSIADFAAGPASGNSLARLLLLSLTVNSLAQLLQSSVGGLAGSAAGLVKSSVAAFVLAQLLLLLPLIRRLLE